MFKKTIISRINREWAIKQLRNHYGTDFSGQETTRKYRKMAIKYTKLLIRKSDIEFDFMLFKLEMRCEL